MPPASPQPTTPVIQIDSVNQETKELVASHHTLFLWAWVFTASLAAAIFCYIYFALADHSIISISQNDGTIVAPFVPVLIPMFIYLYFVRQARQRMVAQIAQSFGYSYATFAPIESVSGVLFTRGHSRKLYDVLLGSYRTFVLRMFSYEYSIQEGKHTRTFYSTVCELTYSAPLPHIILLRHELFGASSDVGWLSGLGKLKKTELEGDFGKYFDLYVENTAEIAVREIFTPDIMQEFIDRFANHDLEIIDSKVYLMQQGQLSTRAEYVALHELADTLIERLLPGLRAASEDTTAPA